ncbi:hypothetical protein SteCoe_9692 [Stentor coeruleus]|uniref:PUM-HD domain-containing protein n=1 Tax=Stentor coeruleus TaxID=5963 RepID=A0A1R2CHD9_9CILI|nr:hypothetical protein SteCoe_9692 [Stentor coeruleus]
MLYNHKYYLMDVKTTGPYSFAKVKIGQGKFPTYEDSEGLSQERISTSFSSQGMSNLDQSNSDHSIEIFKSIPKNKGTSKIMQQIISKSQPDELNSIIEYLLPNIPELMNDIYGNYICQTLFHNCSASHRLRILNALKGFVVSISYNCRGTHAIQNLIAMMNLREEEEVYQNEVRGKVVEMSKDVNASHVIQRLLVTVHNRFFITREIKEHVEELATDKLGVCVVKKCCNDPQIMSEILGNSLLLMQHPYGNYAIQTAIEIWKEEAAHEFFSAIQGRCSQLCLQKYSSNVMERALKIENIRKSIVKELISNGKIPELLLSQYGSYVLRTTAEYCEKELKNELLVVVEPATLEMFNLKLKPLWTEIIRKLSY